MSIRCGSRDKTNTCKTCGALFEMTFTKHDYPLFKDDDKCQDCCLDFLKNKVAESRDKRNTQNEGGRDE